MNIKRPDFLTYFGTPYSPPFVHFPFWQMEVKLEVELWDKKGAIELLGKYKKMFSDKLELGLPSGSKVSFSINGVIK